MKNGYEFEYELETRLTLPEVLKQDRPFTRWAWPKFDGKTVWLKVQNGIFYRLSDGQAISMDVESILAKDYLVKNYRVGNSIPHLPVFETGLNQLNDTAKVQLLYVWAKQVEELLKEKFPNG